MDEMMRSWRNSTHTASEIIASEIIARRAERQSSSAALDVLIGDIINMRERHRQISHILVTNEVWEDIARNFGVRPEAARSSNMPPFMFMGCAVHAWSSDSRNIRIIIEERANR